MYARCWTKTLLAAAVVALWCPFDVAAFVCGPPRPPGNDMFFERPQRARKLSFNLVQAFSECHVGDTTTEGGVPACTPETRNEAAGSPANGWHWDPAGSRGTLTLTSACRGAADAAVSLSLSGIVDGNGDPAAGSGALVIGVRATSDDPVGGFLTAANTEIAISFPLVNGAVRLKTTATAMRAAAGLPPFPNATSLEIAETVPTLYDSGMLAVRDPNGTTFARPGIATPGKSGGPTCGFPHPTVSSKMTASLVQIYSWCTPPGNTTTEGGEPACTPAQTDHQVSGSPSGGWRWDTKKASATVTLAPKRDAACVAAATTLPPACPGGPNPSGDSSDLVVTLALSGLLDTLLRPVDGGGTVGLVMRTTIDDRLGGPMTMHDFPVSLPFAVVGGKARLKTSINAKLNDVGHPGLPPCASAEILSVWVSDQNFSSFANLGLWMP